MKAQKGGEFMKSRTLIMITATIITCAAIVLTSGLSLLHGWAFESTPDEAPATNDENVNVENNDVESALDGDHSFDVRRVILEGEIESIDVKALLNKYEKNFYNLTILDRTTPPVDLWEGLEEDSLKGIFLRKLKALDIDEEICEMAARYGVAAIENKEGV